MGPFRLALLYLRLGAMNELQYRVNFLVQLLQSAISLVTGLVGLWLIYAHTSTLDGWTAEQLLALMGVHTLMGGLVAGLIQPNMMRLVTDVQQGTLDFTLTKPEDAQLLLSVREIRFWEVVTVAMGLGILVVAAIRLQNRIGLAATLGFILLLLVGMLLLYSFWLILSCTAFWVVRIDEIANLFQGIYAAGRYPIGIYPGWLRYGLTFVVPVGIAVTVPAESITDRLTGTTVLGAVALTACAVALSRAFLQFGLRRYSGASS